MKPVPITIFTGFLGAGKTTLILDLLRQSTDRSVGILINEFGETAIDGMSLSRATTEGNVRLHNITGALIGYADDTTFAQTMRDFANARDLDDLFIETSGLAVPSAIIERLRTVDGAGFRLDSIVTVVDTPRLMHDAAASPPMQSVFAQQLDTADIVVLNKIDDLSESELLVAEKRVRELAPQTRFVELSYNRHLDRRLVVDVGLHEFQERHRHKPAGAGPVDGHEHSGLTAHEHGLLTHQHLHEHDPGWLAFSLHSHAMQQQEKLSAALSSIAEIEPVMRIKGFVHDGTGGLMEVQCVRERLSIQRASDELPHPQEEPVSQLVFIGYHLNREIVCSKMQQMTGTDWQ